MSFLCGKIKLRKMKSNSFSTLSSGINAMSILVLNDYILLWKPKLNEKVRLTISKVTSKIVWTKNFLIAKKTRPT